MPVFYKFSKNDIYHNTIKCYPRSEFLIYDRKVYYNNTPELPGHLTSSTFPSRGKLNLYEYNVDRPSNQLIYPFLTKEGSLTTFSTVTTAQFNNNFAYGDIITGSYCLETSISQSRYAAGQTRTEIQCLQNTLNYYKKISPHFGYSSSLGNKATQELGIISIPSIFYGSSINKGTVECKFYISGTLAGHLKDENRNGELIQIAPSGSLGTGSCAGVVLYNEGFIILTGSWAVNSGHTEPYVAGQPAKSFRWIYFGSTGAGGVGENLPSSSFNLTFEGINYVPVTTMLCHAPRGELNHSNNPTYIKFGQGNTTEPYVNNNGYKENPSVEIKNIVKSDYSDPTASFAKQTYINKIGIYDEHKNLIGVAKLAKPLRKKIKDSYTIKLKIDI